MTISRPGAPARPLDLLETPEPRRRVPRWAVLAVIGTVLLGVVGVNAVTAARDRARARTAADRLDLRIVPGGAGTAYVDGVLQLSFAVDNRGRDVAFREPALDPPLFGLFPGPPPNPVAAGSAGVFYLRGRPSCGEVATATGPFVLRLPVIPPSGRTHILRLPLDSDLLLNLAKRACGLVGPAQGAQLTVASPVRALPDGISFTVAVGNDSRLGFAVTRLTAPGLRLRTDRPLPVPVLPGRTARLGIHLSVASCALVSTVGGERQAGAVPVGAIELELSGEGGRTEYARLRTTHGEPVFAAWTSYVARTCGLR